MDGNRPEEVDKAMKVCTNFPMGPLELIDLAGVDIVLHGLETMGKDFGDRYHPAPLIRQMVRAGHLGRKTKKGFYNYGSSDFSVGNPLVYNGSKEDWSHARY